MRMLCRSQGGLVAYGRWHVLLGILYQEGGRMELSELVIGYLSDELEFADSKELMEFLAALSDVGCIEREFLERGVVASRGVCNQLDFIERSREAGSKGGRPRKQKG